MAVAGDEPLSDSVSVLEETLRVDKTVRESDRFWIKNSVVERTEYVDLDLLTGEALIERVQVNRIVDTAPPIREEGDIIIVPLKWREAGWSGRYAGLTEQTQQTLQSSRPSTSASGTVAGGSEEVIPVYEEQLRVGKREVERGSVRVRSYVIETPVQQQVQLHEERVEIERRPVDRPATAGDVGSDAFRQRTIEVTATAEEAVCVFRGKSATDSGMKPATDSDLISAIPI